MKRWRLLGRHKWVAGATISESCPVGVTASDQWLRSFTATIRGYRNWKIYRGEATAAALAYVIAQVQTIRDRIDDGDESVFSEPNEFAQEAPDIAQAEERDAAPRQLSLDDQPRVEPL